ncbi:esterase [Steroidobacter agaridevorans]|uniref:Esterase n=1 Tax=Steroidobacter agaridevorans TaxID=2695856 RepID=A0A829YI70_9GAMM|nr:serine hydrolase domain-containing protein [Steroidobacter agaridevorans]GFE82521.1 esterase [Steroidobacter agaridevorans]
MAVSNESMSIVSGYVAPGFEAVRAAFGSSLRRGEEIGGSLAVCIGNRMVVDLWGGLRDRRANQPWEQDTLALVFSTSKGLAALAMALAHSRGWLDYDQRVAHYWPEFACHGKEAITVRQLLAHEAGLSSVTQTLTPQLLGDLDALAAVLATQRPQWTPGEQRGYHPITLGLYQNELMRRADPQHRNIGEVLQQEIAGPLGAEAYIGLPDTISEDRLARLERRVRASEQLRSFGIYPGKFVLAMMWPGHVTRLAFTNPRVRSLEEFSARPWLRLQMPSANAVANARGIARIYGEFASGGQQLGLKSETLSMLEAPVQPSAQLDAVLYIDSAYSLGFWKPCTAFQSGANPRIYGTPGAGGSVGFADPSLAMGFAYVPNRLGLHMIEGPRANALRAVVYDCARALQSSMK